jgi:hypothetical protein
LVGAGIDDDMRTLRGQLQDRRAADVAPGTGYQRDFTVKLTHEQAPLHRAPSPTRQVAAQIDTPHRGAEDHCARFDISMVGLSRRAAG